MIAAVQKAEESPFKEIAQDGGQQQAEQDGGKKAAACVLGNHRFQREGHIGPDHIETAMGQVDDAHDAKDQCQSAGYKKKQQAVLHCIKRSEEHTSELP